MLFRSARFVQRSPGFVGDGDGGKETARLALQSANIRVPAQVRRRGRALILLEERGIDLHRLRVPRPLPFPAPEPTSTAEASMRLNLTEGMPSPSFQPSCGYRQGEGYIFRERDYLPDPGNFMSSVNDSPEGVWISAVYANRMLKTSASRFRDTAVGDRKRDKNSAEGRPASA